MLALDDGHDVFIDLLHTIAIQHPVLLSKGVHVLAYFAYVDILELVGVVDHRDP
jgi:hypothetical protein